MSLLFYIETVLHTEVLLAHSHGKTANNATISCVISAFIHTHKNSAAAERKCIKCDIGQTFLVTTRRRRRTLYTNTCNRFDRNGNGHTCCTDCNDTRKCCIENVTLLVWDEVLAQKWGKDLELSHCTFITSRAVKPRYSVTFQSPHNVQGISISKHVLRNREFLFTGYGAILGVHCIPYLFQQSRWLLKSHIYCAI